MPHGADSAGEAMLHVGVDATSWENTRGFGRFTRELVRALVERKTPFRYTLLFDRVPDCPLPAGAAVLSAQTRRTLNQSAVGTSSRSIGYLWRMARLARKGRFDLLFFPSVYSYFPIATRRPMVVCFHDATAERVPQLLFETWLNHRLWKVKTSLARWQATRAMTVSHASAADLETILHIPGESIDVVTEAADPSFRVIDDPAALARARLRHHIPRNVTLLAHLGGMNRHKNLIGLLQALVRIVAERPDVYLAIVGDTSGRGFSDNVPELYEFVKANPPLEQHVRFTGYLPDADVVELLNATDALVFPSLWEGFGLPAVEAMSCGLPILASRRGSLPEVIGNAGLFFDPTSPVAMAECVLRFLRDPQLGLRLRAEALKRARLFSWERAAALAEVSFRRCYEDWRRRRGRPIVSGETAGP